MNEFEKKAREAAKESAQDAGLTTSPMTERAGAYISGYHSGAEWAKREFDMESAQDWKKQAQDLIHITRAFDELETKLEIAVQALEALADAAQWTLDHGERTSSPYSTLEGAAKFAREALGKLK